MWFEEPVPAEDLDGYRELRQALPIPVAGAEGRSGLGSFREVVESGAMEIIQPDIGRAGDSPRECGSASSPGRTGST